MMAGPDEVPPHRGVVLQQRGDHGAALMADGVGPQPGCPDGVGLRQRPHSAFIDAAVGEGERERQHECQQPRDATDDQPDSFGLRRVAALAQARENEADCVGHHQHGEQQRREGQEAPGRDLGQKKIHRARAA